jgi:hypothetical protein
MASLLIRKLEERHRWLILVRQHLCAETPAGSKQRVMRWWSYERALTSPLVFPSALKPLSILPWTVPL